jgi:hypothetical protein
MRPFLPFDDEFKTLSIAIDSTHGETVIEIKSSA